MILRATMCRQWGASCGRDAGRESIQPIAPPPRSSHALMRSSTSRPSRTSAPRTFKRRFGGGGRSWLASADGAGVPRGPPSVRLPTFGRRKDGRVHADGVRLVSAADRAALRGFVPGKLGLRWGAGGRNVAGSAGRPRLVSRLWVRLASATKATTLRRPPQAHARTSSANTRRRSSAQGSRRGRDTPGGPPGGSASSGVGGVAAGQPG
jgi:hypothetical protein